MCHALRGDVQEGVERLVVRRDPRKARVHESARGERVGCVADAGGLLGDGKVERVAHEGSPSSGASSSPRKRGTT